MSFFNTSFFANDRGVVAVEAALILPVIILLAFSVIQASTYFYNLNLLTNAAMEAARVGSLYTTPRASVQEIINSACSFLGTTANGTTGCNAGSQLINYAGSSPQVGVVITPDTLSTTGVESAGTAYSGSGIGSSLPCPTSAYSGASTGTIVVVTLSFTFNGIGGGTGSWGVFNQAISATSKMTCQ